MGQRRPMATWYQPGPGRSKAEEKEGMERRRRGRGHVSKPSFRTAHTASALPGQCKGSWHCRQQPRSSFSHGQEDTLGISWSGTLSTTAERDRERGITLGEPQMYLGQQSRDLLTRYEGKMLMTPNPASHMEWKVIPCKCRFQWQCRPKRERERS